MSSTAGSTTVNTRQTALAADRETTPETAVAAPSQRALPTLAAGRAAAHPARPHRPDRRALGRSAKDRWVAAANALYELKWDGFRASFSLGNGTARLWSKNGTDFCRKSACCILACCSYVPRERGELFRAFGSHPLAAGRCCWVVGPSEVGRRALTPWTAASVGSE